MLSRNGTRKVIGAKHAGETLDDVIKFVRKSMYILLHINQEVDSDDDEEEEDDEDTGSTNEQKEEEFKHDKEINIDDNKNYEIVHQFPQTKVIK